MATKHREGLEELLSSVRVKLLDPLGNAISGLRYQVRQGTKVVARGVTDAEGRVAQFASEIGQPISVHVATFLHEGMKQISEFSPWNERFSVKLVSGKTKLKAPLKPHEGPAGGYRRKTYIVKPGDSLSQIAHRHHVGTLTLARTNRLELESIIVPGQVLQIPMGAKASAGGPSATPASASPSANPPAAAPKPSSAIATDRHEASAENGPPAEPLQTNVPPRVPTPPTSSTNTSVVVDRSENGTPKQSVSMDCANACIKLGDQGPLIEELNIRLTGFGGTVTAGEPLNKFTPKTEAAVKQFQRDYMGAPETGKVCGPLLQALDEFGRKFSLPLAAMKCRCKLCNGFGSGLTSSADVHFFNKAGAARSGTEYPGIHRSLQWAVRAARFYTEVKDKNLTFKYLKVSSGYRCWHDNKQHSRMSTNHMGNALDLQFTKGKSTVRCEGADVDALRAEVFVKRLGAQLGWPDANMLSLETAKQGATNWVHVDVRNYAAAFKDSRYYAVTQASADGDPLTVIAQRESRLTMLACGGVKKLPATGAAAAVTAASDDSVRVSADSLNLSPDGLKFVMGWEKCNLEPYNDSEGYCTIGWGHLIGKQSCASLAHSASFQPFKNGLTQAAADRLFATDARVYEEIVKDSVQVPLFQHEYDALVSLMFNTGGFSKCPKLLSKLNTKDYNGCCDEFADITNHGTKGLVLRRKAEMKMFRNAVYDSSH